MSFSKDILKDEDKSSQREIEAVISLDHLRDIIVHENHYVTPQSTKVYLHKLNTKVLWKIDRTRPFRFSTFWKTFQQRFRYCMRFERLLFYYRTLRSSYITMVSIASFNSTGEVLACRLINSSHSKLKWILLYITENVNRYLQQQKVAKNDYNRLYVGLHSYHLFKLNFAENLIAHKLFFDENETSTSGKNSFHLFRFWSSRKDNIFQLFLMNMRLYMYAYRFYN